MLFRSAIYLRVVNSLGVESFISVKDKEKEIPVDGKYHQVYSYVETNYKLMNVVWDSVTNWTPDCILEQVWKTDVSLDRYFGEFERLPMDSYYTLTLNFKIEYSEPFKYNWPWFLDWDNITFTYSDDSNLSYSPAE